MRSKRKDEHVAYALKSDQPQLSDMDLMRYYHNSLPNCSLADIDMATDYLGHHFMTPIYINAMTGGSSKTQTINGKLALIAKHFNLAMAVGSQHAALDDPQYEASFKVVRDVNPDGFIIGNVSANASVAEAQRAIAMIQANALGIHLNAAQEIVMPEGDRDFSGWLDNIKAIVEAVDVPVIVKEVGNGMTQATVDMLYQLGVKHVDVSGRGGTNFVWIESSRSQTHNYDYLVDWGMSAMESLLLNRDNLERLELFASGGIRTPLDVLKHLTLGAKAVGISGMFLRLTQLEEHDMIKSVEKFMNEMQNIMLLLGARDVQALRTCAYNLEGRLTRYNEK